MVNMPFISQVTLNGYSFENVAFHVLHERIPLYTFRTLSDWWDHRTSLNRWRTVDHYVRRCRGNVRILESVDFIGRTSELARLFGILFFSVICRGSQVFLKFIDLRFSWLHIFRYRCKIKNFRLVSLWSIFEFYESQNESVIIYTPLFRPSIASTLILTWVKRLLLMNAERTKKYARYARERALRAVCYDTRKPLGACTGCSEVLVFVYSLCCFVVSLVSRWVNDVKDCKADELHRSLPQYRTTCTVSPPWYVPT